MKKEVIALLLVLFLVASCTFKVNSDDIASDPVRPDSASARVFKLEDKATLNSVEAPITKQRSVELYRYNKGSSGPPHNDIFYEELAIIHSTSFSVVKSLKSMDGRIYLINDKPVVSVQELAPHDQIIHYYHFQDTNKLIRTNSYGLAEAYLNNKLGIE
ncbi:MAG: hypothetical protein U9R08_03175 [Nanoarchaeota archaeon]|nr:hypothetical protein [Nanoarchaeota archaeon]